MQLRQAAALHHTRYRGAFHSAASLAAAQTGMKFAVAHNIHAIDHNKTPVRILFKMVKSYQRI